MPSKAEFYRQMAEHVSTRLVGSWKEWTAFLTTAARLYKYPFHEQMMIYAQRPDATACAEYDLWNEKMGRYVRRGTKGIALVDDSSDKPRLRYVFDISDTGTREHSRTPWLWQLEEQHIGPVSAMLERNYGVAGDDLAQQLTDVAGKLASEYWDEHQQDFRYIVDDSFLEEYDDLNIDVQFKSAATVSISLADGGEQAKIYQPDYDFQIAGEKLRRCGRNGAVLCRDQGPVCRRPPYQGAHGPGCGGLQAEADESRPPEQAVPSGGPAAQILPGGNRKEQRLYPGL